MRDTHLVLKSTEGSTSCHKHTFAGHTSRQSNSSKIHITSEKDRSLERSKSGSRLSPGGTKPLSIFGSMIWDPVSHRYHLNSFPWSLDLPTSRAPTDSNSVKYSSLTSCPGRSAAKGQRLIAGNLKRGYVPCMKRLIENNCENQAAWSKTSTPNPSIAIESFDVCR